MDQPMGKRSLSRKPSRSRAGSKAGGSREGEQGKILYVLRRVSDGKFRCRSPGRMIAGWVKDPTSPGCVMSEEKARSLASPKRGTKGMEAVWLGEALGFDKPKELTLTEGKKFDDGKPRYDLVDDDAEAEFVAVLSFGAIKYEPDNWRSVPELKKRAFSALRRHLRSFRRGDLLDGEMGLHHLAAASACVHFLLGKSLEEHPELIANFEERMKAALDTARKIRAAR